MSEGMSPHKVKGEDHYQCREVKAERDALKAENNRLREALDTLTLIVGLTPISGNKQALQAAMDLARKELGSED